jgi:hypothetical protein
LALKNRVAALEVGLDILEAEVFKNGDEHFHRQEAPPADVDASDKGDIGFQPKAYRMAF